MNYAFACSPQKAAELGASGFRRIVRLRELLNERDPATAMIDGLHECLDHGIDRLILTLRWEHPTEEEVDTAPTTDERNRALGVFGKVFESAECLRFKEIILQVGNEPERMWRDEETIGECLEFAGWLRHVTRHMDSVRWSTAAITAGSLLVSPGTFTDEIAWRLRVIRECLAFGNDSGSDYRDLHLNVGSVEDAHLALWNFNVACTLAGFTELPPMICSECSTVRDPHIASGDVAGQRQTILGVAAFMRDNFDRTAWVARQFGSKAFAKYPAPFDGDGRPTAMYDVWRREVYGRDAIKAGA